MPNYRILSIISCQSYYSYYSNNFKHALKRNENKRDKAKKEQVTSNPPLLRQLPLPVWQAKVQDSRHSYHSRQKVARYACLLQVPWHSYHQGYARKRANGGKVCLLPVVRCSFPVPVSKPRSKTAGILTTQGREWQGMPALF